MKIKFLEKTPDCNRLILFFAGWSIEPEMLGLTPVNGWDMAVVYDYDNFDIDHEVTESYHTVCIFAWSLGVVAAEYAMCGEENVTGAYAINGTLYPVDDNLGIPANIYHATTASLTPLSLQKFRRRMVDSNATFRRLFPIECDAGKIMNLKRQLQRFEEVSEENYECEPTLPWRRAYVSNGDAIFPYRNMLNGWKQAGVTAYAYGAHHYVDFNHIIRSVIHDTERTSGRFTAALETYQTYAAPQRAIANRLLEAMEKYGVRKGGKWMEIGPGAGLFTDMYAPVFKPEEATYVDIAELKPFKAASKETYFKQDAEIWIDKASGFYDCIVSSCVFQWFVNLPHFLKRCNEILEPKGILAFSILISGTLGELDSVRQSPIDYYRAEDLRKILGEYFTDIRIEEYEIKEKFASSREMLIHLKHTGVGGSAPSSGIKLGDVSDVNALTYRAAICICRASE